MIYHLPSFYFNLHILIQSFLFHESSLGEVSTFTEKCSDEQAMQALDMDPLGVVTHYALTKLDQIITTLSKAASGVSVSSVFYVGKDGLLVEQWKALLRILNKGGKGDVFAQKVASMSLAKILLASCPSKRSASTDGKARPVSYVSALEPMEALNSWIVNQLKNASGSMVGLSSPALMVMMDAYESRMMFCQAGGIKYIARQLRVENGRNSDKKSKVGSGSVQQLYELSFCLWILTYELNRSHTIRADFAKDGQPVLALVELVSLAPREKVVRVALSSLRNLATCTSEEDPEPALTATHDGNNFLSEMIACGLMKSVELLKGRQFTDPDMVEDVTTLHKLLTENYHEMTRWEVYKNEVESGHLKWGSTHTEAFFKENARMIEGSDGDFRLLKVLIAILSGSDDEEVTAIACYDIGEFVRHYPNGRAIAKRLGAKDLVMPLIEHENPELQRHALQCVSKIMVNNWEYVK
jgi:V-type H+-transporting ATPase subunit H